MEEHKPARKMFEVYTTIDCMRAYSVVAETPEEAKMKLVAYMKGDSDEDLNFRIVDWGDEYATGDVQLLN